MSTEDKSSQRAQAETGNAAQQQRLEALRAMSAHAPAPLEHAKPRRLVMPPSSASKSQRVLVGTLLVAALALSVLGGGTIAGIFPWALHAPSKPFTIKLAASRLACPQGAEWSPDGQHIAVAASLGGCNYMSLAQSYPNVVAFFDRHGTLERSARIDSAVVSQLALSGWPGSSAGTSTQIYYSTMNWSPDSQLLALYFTAERQSPAQSHPDVAQGIALLNSDGSAVSAFRQSLSGSVGQWDLTTHQETGDIMPVLQPGARLRWTSTGKLTSVAGDVSAGEPVGNPSGGAAFSAWQPGVVSINSDTSTLFFGASFMAWSPNGHVLAPSVSTAFQLPSGQTAKSSGLLTGPFHDSAMRKVAEDLRTHYSPNLLAIPVAWRPDGRVLAALVPDTNFAAHLGTQSAPHSAEQVILYDCATGKALETLSTAQVNDTLTTPVAPASLIRWRADGKQVLFLDTEYAILTIWNTDGLERPSLPFLS